MKLSYSSLATTVGFLMALVLCAGLSFFAQRASAQKISINKDGTQTTSEPDNTYGEGGTKETVRNGSGKIIKVVKKAKDGKRRSSIEYPLGAKAASANAAGQKPPGETPPEPRIETTWVYDSRGRLVSMAVDWVNLGREWDVEPSGRVRRTIEYDGDNDTKGKSTDEGYDSRTGEWKPVDKSQGGMIDHGLETDPDHDYSPDKPQSVIGDLGRPTRTASPSPKPPPKIKLGLDYKFKSISSPGLNTDIVTFPSGSKLIINRPNDIAVGDTFSGTVLTEVTGKDEMQRARNQSELNGSVLLIGGQPMRVTEKIFTRTILQQINADKPFLILKVNGKEVAAAPVQISQTPAPQPANTQLPTCGQMGRNVVVVDHCDGIIAPTDSCTIGGTQLQPLAESPRMRVLQNTSQTLGQTEIKYSEQGNQASGPFLNLGVNLSSPNTNLLRGQKTTLEVVALVKGIRQDVLLDLVNDTPGVVSISGGNDQHFTIHPADVQVDGTYQKSFTVTANSAGAWGATATVSCLGASGAGGPGGGGPQGAAGPGGEGGAGPTPKLSPSPSPSSSPCEPTPTPTTYMLKDLSPVPGIVKPPSHCMATGVNYASNVVGFCAEWFGDVGYRAFLTDPDKVIEPKDELPFPAGAVGGGSWATAVNASGHVVGWWWAKGAAGDTKGFRYDGSKSINLHPPKSPFKVSEAYALNKFDDVVGSAWSFFADKHAVIWLHDDPTTMIDLNDYMAPSAKKDWKLTQAYAINDEGHIVGRGTYIGTGLPGEVHAFLLKGKGAIPIDLGALAEKKSDSSAAYSINACDEVVGYTAAIAEYDGFLWTESSKMLGIGTFLGPHSASESFAQAINKKEETVGAVGGFHKSESFHDGPGISGGTDPLCIPYSHAFWYGAGKLKDLNTLIPDYPGWELNLANAINDKGQIAGSGFYKEKGAPCKGSLLSKAVLLTPVGLEPTASAAGPAACPLSAPAKSYIFDNWNICGVKNGPTKDTTFTIDGPSLITFIATYHWNYGSGALPGKKGISLKDSSGKVFGPWGVTTSAGSGGKANVNWECHPGITLPAGSYTVIDPDPATWSQNDASGHSGFVRVAGSPKK